MEQRRRTMAKVLVTGGAGFIGSHLVDALISQGHRVTVVDDLSSGRRENLVPEARFIRADIRSSRMKDVWQDFRPEYVFHLAAQKNLRTSVNDPLLDADINITGSLNIIELSRQFKIKKFIFSSTGGAIYGEDASLPTPESAPPQPESPYGISKFTIEQYLDFFQKYRGLPSVSLRYANVYGPRQDPKGEAGVVVIFTKKLLEKKLLLINGDGKQTRDFIFVSDVVQANLQAMQRSQARGEINIGTGKQTSVNELGKKLLRLAGMPSRLKRRPPIAGELKKSALSTKHAKKILNWKSEVKLETGLKLTWEWAKEVL
jgi:UDP-glucose 4-epimerase